MRTQKKHSAPDGPVEIIVAKKRSPVKMEIVEDHPLIGEILNFYVEEWKRDHTGDKLPRTYFYNSDVGRCWRSIYYQFKFPEKKKPMSAGTIMMFKFGDLFHEEMQRVIRALGHTTSKDIEFGTWSKIGFERRGRIDVLMKEIEGKVVFTVVMEIKSKNSYAFDSEPEDNEIDQAMSYLDDIIHDKYFEGRGKKIAEYFYIFYVERGGLAEIPIKMWRVEYSLNRVEEVKCEFTALHEMIEKNQVPPRPYERNSIPCTYCRFRDSICWLGVPAPPPPGQVSMESMAPPASAEIVESMADRFIILKREILEKEKELELAENVIKHFCRSTGATSIRVGSSAVEYETYSDGYLNQRYLFKKLKNLDWTLFAKAQIGLLRGCLKAGLIDGELIARAMEYTTKDRLRVRKAKVVEDGKPTDRGAVRKKAPAGKKQKDKRRKRGKKVKVS